MKALKRIIVGFFIVLAGILIFFFALACQSNPEPVQYPYPLIQSKELVESDSGNLLLLKKGDLFTISLEANATAGYQWMPGRLDQNILEVEETLYRVYTDKPGSAGMATWKIRALKEARTQLILNLCQPWECENSVAKTYFIEIWISE